MTIVPKFVSRVPHEIEEGIIYISIEVNTAVHLCPCGCKTEIVTPLDPSDWNFTYDGENISLSPSVGVWGAKCKSHYWIIKNKIKWARTYSENEIKEVRKYEALERKEYLKNKSKNDKWWKKFI